MKKRILFIARNIPTPNQRANGVILKIAQKLSAEFELDFIFPKEIIPFGVNFLPKYRPLFNLVPWKYENLNIQIQKYLRLPIPSSAFLFTNHFLPKKKINPGYKLIHAHFIFPDGILAYKYAMQWAIPFVVTIRESDLVLLRKVKEKSSTWNWAKKILTNAKMIHVLNKTSLDFLSHHFNLKAVLIPHGIDTNNILQSFTPKEENGTVQISVVGEAISTKQIDWVINAVNEYEGIKNVELTIVGDGTKLNELKKLGQGNSNIRFLGKIPHHEVFEHLRQSDIFALPSCKETFGLVYLEAAANCNAIIGFYNAGIFGVLEEGKEIFYIKNYSEFKSKLFQLIDEKNTRELMSKNALEKAKELTWENIINHYSDIYHQALNI